ncbi:MAG: putative nuclease of putative toxin-antitoxin system [Methanobacteriota archaeon]|jgi:predicted nuclease of predicted toxin-antitoxin system|uniref:DUF5615 family PIN-like protein n=1 Tax=Halorutilus salinus TaxID=2487751 RepID=A0A9Q4C2V2_9EURY|nr:DUF5615 family PIN-like protein [Halorutilus salinus]MCX2818087.1 DUF5615 family PIN-like protein [Halorutilus salinus]
MTVSFLTDEHVPRVFCTVLRSNGYTVVRAREAFGEETDDEKLLEHCESEDHLLVTHDKKDFASHGSDAGVIVYTDSNFLRDEPETAVRTVERVLDMYPTSELHGEVVWLSQWRS